MKSQPRVYIGTDWFDSVFDSLCGQVPPLVNFLLPHSPRHITQEAQGFSYQGMLDFTIRVERTQVQSLLSLTFMADWNTKAKHTWVPLSDCSTITIMSKTNHKLSSTSMK